MLRVTADSSARRPLLILLARATRTVVATSFAAAASLALAADQESRPDSRVLLGRVLDADSGTPLIGAFVGVTREGDALPATGQSPSMPSGNSSARSTLTGTDGYFVFRDLVPGRYLTTLSAFGYASNITPPQVVELDNPGRVTAVTVTLPKLSAISGRVVDENGDPEAGIAVSALRPAFLGGEVLLHQTFVVSTTDDRGVYRLAGLEPGQYVVGVISETTTLPAVLADDIDVSAKSASALPLQNSLLASGADLPTGEGFRTGELVILGSGRLPSANVNGGLTIYPTTYFPGTSRVADATVIRLRAGEVRLGVDLAIAPLPAIRVSGKVSAPAGLPRRLAVSLVSANSIDVMDTDPAGRISAVTDPDGSFVFPAVPSGRYVLRSVVLMQDLRDERGTGSLFWLAQPVTVLDSDLTDITAAMRPGFRVSGRLEFKVVPGRVQPALPAGRVLLKPLGAQGFRSIGSRVAADGTFRTGGDPPGRYIAIAPNVPGLTLQSVSVSGKTLTDDVVDLGDSDLSGLLLTYTDRPSRIHGRVSDATPGFGTDVAVVAFPADKSFWRDGVFIARRERLVRATSAGAFEISGLASGSYYLAAVTAAAVNEWRTPAFLDQLVAHAVTITIADGESRQISLTTSRVKVWQ